MRKGLVLSVEFPSSGNRERRAAAAGRRGSRIEEFQAGAVKTVDPVELQALQEIDSVGLNVNSYTLTAHLHVALPGPRHKGQTVFVARAATISYTQAQAADRAGLPGHAFFDVAGRCLAESYEVVRHAVIVSLFQALSKCPLI